MSGPIDPEVIELAGRVFDLAFDDGTAVWVLGPTGTWDRRHLSENGEPLRDMQETLVASARRLRRAPVAPSR